MKQREFEKARRSASEAASSATAAMNLALEQKLKATSMENEAKVEIERALMELSRTREATTAAEAVAAENAEKASVIAERNRVVLLATIAASAKLQEDMEAAERLEKEAKAEALRKELRSAESLVAKKECDDANSKLAELAAERERLKEALGLEQIEAQNARTEAETAERVKQEAVKELAQSQAATVAAEKVAQLNTEKRLNAAVKSEEEKAALLQIVAEANALNQKKIFAERKARGEAEKAAAAEVRFKLAEEQRTEAERRRAKEMESLKSAEADAELQMQKRLDLVKATEEERAAIKKALKQAEAHRAVKKKAEAKLQAAEEEMRAIVSEQEKAAGELEQGRKELAKVKEEARLVKEEARLAFEEAEDIKAAVSEMNELKKEKGKAREIASNTRAETQSIIKQLQDQLAEQRKLAEQRAKADEELKEMEDQAAEVKKKSEDMEKEMEKEMASSASASASASSSSSPPPPAGGAASDAASSKLAEMVAKEKAMMEEHKSMLECLAREAAALKEKRLELEAKRNEESRALKEMMEKNNAKGEENLEGGNKMLKSKGSLYDLLEKGDTNKGATGAQADDGGLGGLLGGDKEKLGGLLEEDENDENDDDDHDDGDWRLKVCSTCRKKRGDLPVAHFAAASGHLDCLTSINNTAADAITSFDKAQRSPLFYSCANNQTLTAVLLIEVAPQLVQLCDTNGDTPLHAASSAGSAELIELLISRGGADVNAVNLLGISPAHLCKNRRCLEVLFDAGADIYLKDKQKRSPLFVSCAMNRRDCAEFICEIIEIEGGSFQEVDRRGDTPLHAAACNGSISCAGMLLDLAVEPGVRNKKGLRPIDLAARRGHEKCEQLLAEFHLHHAAGAADFDSVFFLATLQGHKGLKAQLDGDDGEAYEIIGKETGETGKKEELERVGSMWSLRTGRSVRLQQWGSWICYEDQNTGSLFWYDQKNKVNSWKKPPEVEDLQAKAMTDATSRWNQLQKCGSMRLKKLGNWIQYTGGMGKTFYFNESTYEFQWERPEELGEDEEGGGVGGGGGGGGEGEGREKEGGGKGGATNKDGKTPKNNATKTAAKQETPEAMKAKKEKEQTEKGIAKIMQSWTTYRDPNSGLAFWHNVNNGESLWEAPPGLADLERKLQKMAGEMEDEEEDADAMVVNGDDDLGI